MNEKNITMKEFQAVNHIIAELYNADLSAYNRIINFFHMLMEIIYFDRGTVIFFTRDTKGVYHKHSSISVNWTNEDRSRKLLKKYNDYYCTLDDTFPVFDKPYPVLINAGDFFDTDHRKETQYYKEYLEPNNCIHSLDGNIMLNNELGIKAGISIYRGMEKKNFSKTDYEILQLFQIHLSNVLRNYGKEDSPTSFLSIIENYNCVGVCILNDTYEVVKKNRVFDDIIGKYSNDIFEKAKNLCRYISMNGKNRDQLSNEYKFEEQSLFIEVNKITNAMGDREQYCCLIYDLSYFVLKSLNDVKDKYTLTAREFEIIQELLKGKSNEDIAKTFYISVSAVKKNLASIYSKMDIKNQKQIFDKLNLL